MITDATSGSYRYTSTEAAAKLGVTRKAFWRAAKRLGLGQPSPIRLRMMFTDADLQAYRERNTKPGRRKGHQVGPDTRAKLSEAVAKAHAEGRGRWGDMTGTLRTDRT